MAAPIAPRPVRWRRFRLAETDASDLVSAACYRGSKHIGIATVVVAELKFRDVERHIFGAHFVECADHAAFEQRPETLNRVGVYSADHVLLLAVVNHLMREAAAQIIAVAYPRVSRQQAHLVGNGLIDKLEHGFGVHALQHAGYNVALPLDCTDDWGLAFRGVMRALVEMAVLVLAANPRLVNLDNAAKLLLRRDQCCADFVAHGMGRLVAAEAHEALNLQGAHSLLTGKHQMGDAIPVAERLLGVLKDRARDGREAVAVRVAVAALPMKRLVARGVVQVRIATARAMDAFRPAPRYEVRKARLVVTNRETGLKLGRGHLRNGFRTFCHGGYPRRLSVGEYCHG